MRRSAFWCVTVGAALAAVSLEAAESFTLTEVKPGVFAAIAKPGDADSVGNAGFVIGSDAVLVVDSFATPRAAEQLLAKIRGRTRLPVRWLVDTHHHADHRGGNLVFAKAGATVVAHEAARARMRERGVSAALPSETYRDAISIWLGDRRVDVLGRSGHTDGDSVVFVPDADVLFGGDLLQNRTVPNLADARTDVWVRTLDELAQRFPSAAIVPGHGAVARPLDMRPLRDYLVTLRTSVSRGLQEGVSGAALADLLVPRLTAQCRGWSGTEHIAETVAQVEAELTDRTTVPAAPTPTP